MSGTGDTGNGAHRDMDADSPAPDDEALARALRRVEEEARPRPEFRVRLRAACEAGGLQPTGGPDPAEQPVLAPPAAAARPLPLPRWFVYPSAAALLLAAAALAGGLEPRAVPEPVAARPGRPSPAEEALVAAERRLAAVPEHAGLRYERSVVEGRPVLLCADATSPDPDELRVVALAISGGESLLAQELPSAAARRTPPLVTVVAPSREVFESLVAPRVAPLPVSAATVAFALRERGVLLLSPGVLDPGGPPCEEMDIVHESVHAWLQARTVAGRPLPPWVEEGLAGLVSQAGAFDTREWCGRLLSAVEENGIDPYFPAEVLDLATMADASRLAAERAPCDERPYSLLPVFHAQAESLVAFLLEDHPGCVHRAGFLAWLEGALDGRADTEAFAAAKEFGFESPEALFEARDAWLKK